MASAPPEAADRLLQREESRFVGRSRGKLGAIRLLYGILAFVGACATFFSWHAYLDTEERTAADLVLVALITATTAFNVAGCLFFNANPFLWTVALAALQTLNLVLSVSGVEQWQAGTIVRTILYGLLVAALWCAVPITARVTKILRERAAAARAHRGATPLATRLAAREIQERRQAMRTFAISSGAVAVLALVAAWLPYRASTARRAEAQERQSQLAAAHAQREATRDTRAGHLEQTASEFRDAWRRSDRERVKSYFESGRQTTFWPQVLELLDTRGWKDKLPPLSDAKVMDKGDEMFEVFYDVEDGERLKTRWSYIGGQWRIVRFMFSKL